MLGVVGTRYNGHFPTASSTDTFEHLDLRKAHSDLWKMMMQYIANRVVRSFVRNRKPLLFMHVQKDIRVRISLLR